ncbi:LysR family transcriptional regulator [Lipingzhangella sp. LS1_29]|uniref:LysR family transcriptional regulator n=1 Tax=Lipingzhangella rawalii TaxID=2055835 RepID=A0ABU2H1R7_9ACTN|nr:LysR family transcriptional regulator [Lipingzhangella rawalii]MDS1269247.1 LysR family transcriptional regulator [Lipingzhangella rawalii]
MTLDANRLRVLVEIAHAGSITAAAERMAFTPAALSQQMTKLEREVGCALIERVRGGVRLTHAGRVAVEHGERVLGELRDAEAALQAAAGAWTTRLGLGAFASAGKILVPQALASFRTAHPHVRLALQDLEPPEGYGLVTSGDLDLLLTHCYPGTSLPAAPALHRERLLVDPLMLVLPDTHAAAVHSVDTPLGLRDLADEEWICGGPGVSNRTALDRVAHQADVEVTVAYETRDYEVTLALVRAGIGVSLIPASVLRAAPQQGWMSRPLSGPALHREIYAVHRRRARGPVLEMVSMLRQAATRTLA